jgi:predicted Rossmann-fold nucleotide-binding protein
VYAEAAHETGRLLSAGGHTLVYGGGNIVLMLFLNRAEK